MQPFVSGFFFFFLLIVTVLRFIHDVRCVGVSSPCTIYVAVNVPLRAALAASHGFCMTVFSSFKISSLISSLTHWFWF